MQYSCKFIRRPMFTVIFGVYIIVLHILCLANAPARPFRGRPYGESVSEYVELRMTWEDGSIDEPFLALALNINVRHVAWLHHCWYAKFKYRCWILRLNRNRCTSHVSFSVPGKTDLSRFTPQETHLGKCRHILQFHCNHHGHNYFDTFQKL